MEEYVRPSDCLLRKVQITMKREPRVLYLFTNDRGATISAVRDHSDTDTPLRGMNHIAGADYLTIRPKSLVAFFALRRLFAYDFVISQDNLFLGYFVSIVSRLFRLKTRWLYLTMTSSNLIRRHAMNPIKFYFLKKFFRSYSHIVCLSTTQVQDLVFIGVDRRRLTFVPLGIDAHFFESSHSVAEENLIVSIGRDSGRDYVTLCKAVEKVDSSVVVVAGPRNIPSDLNIPSNITVLYDQSMLQIKDLFSRARLVVVASKDEKVPDGSDCSGQTVVLDALAAGKTVIATRRAWIADYFIDGQDLVVVPPSSPDALAIAINNLSRDEKARNRIAEAGHKKVIEGYTTRHFAAALQKVMDSII